MEECRLKDLRVPFCSERFSSVNAKQLAQPDFQSDPSRCESGHGCHSNAERGVWSAE